MTTYHIIEIADGSFIVKRRRFLLFVDYLYGIPPFVNLFCLDRLFWSNSPKSYDTWQSALDSLQRRLSIESMSAKTWRDIESLLWAEKPFRRSKNGLPIMDQTTTTMPPCKPPKIILAKGRYE